MLQVQQVNVHARSLEPGCNGVCQGLGVAIGACVHHQDLRIAPVFHPQLLLRPGLVLGHELPALLPDHGPVQRRQLLHVGPVQGLGEHEEPPDGGLRILREEVVVEEVEPLRGELLPPCAARVVVSAAAFGDRLVRAEELSGEERAGCRVKRNAAFGRLGRRRQDEAHGPALLHLQGAPVLDDLDGASIQVLLRQLLAKGNGNEVRATNLERLLRLRSGFDECLNRARLLAIKVLEHDDPQTPQVITDGFHEVRSIHIIVDAYQH
mmetsp:Transcript_149141/g.362203  ORF Transcript_149141/g.362203 Transcript_149141/m.362203 type:complete len:265 (-) Transcript_149141:42-836(-)